MEFMTPSTDFHQGGTLHRDVSLASRGAIVLLSSALRYEHGTIDTQRRYSTSIQRYDFDD